MNEAAAAPTAVVVLSDAPRHPSALIAFTIVAFTVAALVAEFARGTRARRSATGEGWLAALVGLTRRNRRRYGGYLVHAGLAVLLLGVAASSSFATAADQRLRPGESLRLAGYDMTYRRPAPAATPEKLTLSTVVDVSRAGRHVATLRPARELYPAPAGTSIVRRYFSGEQTSEIGLDAGLAKDIWVAARPDLEALEPVIREVDRRFADASPQAQALLIAAILRRWATLGAPVQFRAYVRTGVSWIWLGSGVLGSGTLLAGWPGRGRRRMSVPEREMASAPAPA